MCFYFVFIIWPYCFRESLGPAFNGAVDEGIMTDRAGEMTNNALSHPLTLHDEISPATNEGDC